MASQYPGGMSLADKMREANAKANAEATRLQQFKDFVAQGEHFFKQKFGASPKEYVLNAKLGAYDKTSQANGFQGRSWKGENNALEPEKRGTKGDVKKYHDMEEVAKKCARTGDIQGAINGYHKAADMREAFEKKTGKTPDAGHAGRVTMLRERRNSLIGLKNMLDQTDPDVVAAKLAVQNFFGAKGITYPV